MCQNVKQSHSRLKNLKLLCSVLCSSDQSVSAKFDPTHSLAAGGRPVFSIPVIQSRVFSLLQKNMTASLPAVRGEGQEIKILTHIVQFYYSTDLYL